MLTIAGSSPPSLARVSPPSSARRSLPKVERFRGEVAYRTRQAQDLIDGFAVQADAHASLVPVGQAHGLGPVVGQGQADLASIDLSELVQCLATQALDRGQQHP